MTQLQQSNWPLRYRGLFLGLVLSIIASLLVGLPITRSSAEQLEQQAAQLRNTLAKQVSVQAAEAIFSQDLLSLNVILSGLVEDPQIRYGAVYDLNNNKVAEQGSADTTQGHPLSIRYQNEVIALLEIRLDQKQLNHSIARLFGLWIILSCLFSIISALIGWFTGRELGLKLERIESDILTLNQHNTHLQKSGAAELCGVSLALSEYQQRLHTQQNITRALGQFITLQSNDIAIPVVQADNSIQANTHTQATILFLDIIDLAGAQRAFTPQELADLLDHYYLLIQQASQLYNSQAEKPPVDGIMIQFGISQQDPKDCFHAVCTALLITGLINEYNQARQQQGLNILEFKMGIHSGHILVENNDSSTPVPMSDTLDTALRLCQSAEANQLLLTQETLENGELAGQLIMSRDGNLIGSGLDQTHKTYLVENLTTNYQALIERQVQHIKSQSKGITSKP